MPRDLDPASSGWGPAMLCLRLPDRGTAQQHVCLRPPQAGSHRALPSGESKGASQEPRRPKAGLSITNNRPTP